VSTLPPTLVRFESQLEQAIRRERSRRSRRRVLRVAGAGAAAAAVALGALSTLPGHQPSPVARAAAAFAVDDDTILHFEIVGRQTNPDGSIVTWRSESWQERSAPFARRTIETGPEGVPAETASVGRRTELYDARTNTIYVGEEPPTASRQPRPKLSPGPRPGTSVVTVTKWLIAPGGKPQARTERIVLTTEAAKRLMRRRAAAEPEPATPFEEPFRREILRLLRSGAVADGRVRVGGREALRIVSRDGRTTYLVDAGTYTPIELRTKGDGGEVTLSFNAYEELPRTAANKALVSLSAQHPTAQVNRDPADYRAAQSRLFPHG
jgi:hypothetical protein